MEINIWRNMPVLYSPTTRMSNLKERTQFYGNYKELEEVILDVAHERFHDVVLILIKDRPGEYFK